MRSSHISANSKYHKRLETISIGRDVVKKRVTGENATWVSMKNSMKTSQKDFIRIEFPCDTVIPLLGIFPQHININSKTYVHNYVPNVQ